MVFPSCLSKKQEGPLVKTSKLNLILAAIEGFHIASHANVLFHRDSIKDLNGSYRIAYFSFDLLSNIAAMIKTKRNLTAGMIHLAIHALALAHLTGVYETDFMRDVFKMGELCFDDIPFGHQVLYLTLTPFNMLAHTINGLILMGAL